MVEEIAALAEAAREDPARRAEALEALAAKVAALEAKRAALEASVAEAEGALRASR